MSARMDQQMPGSTDSMLRLIAPASARMEGIELSPAESPAVIGRSSRCRVSLRGPEGAAEDLLLSREHAILEHRGGRWFIRDVSRHGTFLNGIRLTSEEPAVVRSGDHLRVGAHSFEIRVGTDEARTAGGTSIATVDRSAEGSRVRRLRGAEIGNLAQHRLDILLQCAEQTAEVADERALAPLILDAALRGTGLARAAILRPPVSSEAQEMVVLAEHRLGARPTLSRSLVQAAMDGDVAVLTPETSAKFGASIVELGIRQALCAPIMIDGSVDSLLYLDAREGDSPGEPDAAAFCHGLCRIAGLVRGNLQRQSLRREHQAIEQELKSAQIIQTHLLPPPDGIVSGLHYSMRLLPGRQIAGDLFDVIPMSDTAAAVCLGDVAGGGAGPGLVMALTLSHLRAALRQPGDLERAITSLNHYLCERTPANVFVSLWIAAIDSRTRICRWIDAGHGHWLHWRESRALPARRDAAVMPLGIDEATQYVPVETSLERGDRIILYSDGVSECHRRQDGELTFFGRARVEAAIGTSPSPAEDVGRIFAAIRDFCGEQGLADDTTAASVVLAQA
jgi:serine phosphatase RsbU (regulator of sigma subunit)/pSer/pThr/pTyr-binding forkhead associated (FHA) protein